MSFLFRSSKKTQQDRELAGSRDLGTAPAPPIAQPPVRAQTEKPTRGTPTGSLGSLAEDDGSGSPKQPPFNMPRRNTSVDHSTGAVQQQPSSDLAVRCPFVSIFISIYPFTYLFIHLSIHPCVHPSICIRANTSFQVEIDATDRKLTIKPAPYTVS